MVTPRQARFVEEYPVDLNATQAAIRAGYAPGSAEVQGCRLLSNDKIKRKIDKALVERSERAELTQDWVIENLQDSLALYKDWEQGGALNKGLELLGRHIGMWRDGSSADDARQNVTNIERVVINQIQVGDSDPSGLRPVIDAEPVQGRARGPRKR